MAAVTLVAVLAVILALALVGNLLGTGSRAPIASSSASEVAAPSPTESPPVSANPPSTQSVGDRALAALDEVDRAISATTGKGGLKGNERNDLERRAGQVRSALVDGDLDRARAAAADLAERIDQVDKKLDEERARRLADAARTLIDVVSGD